VVRNPSRRDILTSTATIAAVGGLGAQALGAAPAKPAKVRSAAPGKVRSPTPANQIDALLHAATRAGEVPGVVAMAANENDIVYEGAFGWRKVNGTPMTRDTVFRVASMVKVITSVAALQLVEQEKLSLDAPVPEIEPALGAPQVFDGFDKAGKPELRPAKTPISLRQLLTHTSGFTYRLWDAKAFDYFKKVGALPAAERKMAPREPLMFDPGDRWQYGPSIDWVGKIVQQVSGEWIGDYFRKHILDPLGMKDTAFIISPQQQAREAYSHKRHPDGKLEPEPMEKQLPPQVFAGGGGIYSTGPDYLTFIRMLLNGGSLGDVRILRPETVALMGENQIGDVDVGVLHTTSPTVSNDVDFFPNVTRKWGFGHLINMQDLPERRSAGSLTWGGLLNTYYWIDPTKRVAAIFMTQVLPFADHHALRLYRQFERGVYADLATG